MGWYRSQCDGDWEHGYGVVVKTLDNPGWHVKIELTDTSLDGVPFEPIKRGNMVETFPEPDFSNWVICKVEDQSFVGYCGPDDLEELITIFADWSDTASGENS